MTKWMLIILFSVLVCASSVGAICGDSIKIERSDDHLGLNEFLGDVVETIDAADTEHGSEALKNFTLSTSRGTTHVNQYLRLNWGLGAPDDVANGRVKYTKNDDDIVGDFLWFQDGETAFLYELEFVEGLESSINPANGHLTELEGKTVYILGKELTIFSAILNPTTGVELNFISGSFSDSIGDGSTKTYNVNGREYNITVLSVASDGTSTQLLLNGERSRMLTRGGAEIFTDGTIIGIKNIVLGVAGEPSHVEIYFGASTLLLRDKYDAGVWDGIAEVNEERIEDADVMIQYSTTLSTVRVNKISYKLYTDGVAGDEPYIAPGHGLREKLDEPEGMISGNWDVSYDRLPIVNRSGIYIIPNGNDKYRLTFTNSQGITYTNLSLAYVNSTGLYYGDNQDTLVFQQGTDLSNQNQYTIKQNDYFVLSHGSDTDTGVTRVLRLNSLDTVSRMVRMTDVGTGAAINAQYNLGCSIGTASSCFGQINVGGYSFDFYVISTSATGKDHVKLLVDLDDNGISTGGRSNLVVLGGGIISLGSQPVDTYRQALPGNWFPFTLVTKASKFEENPGFDETFFVNVSGSIASSRMGVNPRTDRSIGLVFNHDYGVTDIVSGMTNYGVRIIETSSSIEPERLSISYPLVQQSADVFVIFECSDSDGDSVPDYVDNCPGNPNPDQTDSDSDGVGDVCECTDIDRDGFCRETTDCNDNDANMYPPVDGMIITHDTTLCSGTYNLPNGISIGADDVDLNCAGVVLNGTGIDYAHMKYGIYVFNSNRASVSNCNIRNYHTGIQVYFNTSNNVLIDNNVISENAVGIDVRSFSVGNVITHNALHLNNEGIVLGPEVRNNQVLHNTLSNSHSDGIYLFEADFNVISNNTIFECNKGVLLSSSNNNVLNYNNIFNNNWGIYLYSYSTPSSGNVIENNSILANYRYNLANIQELDISAPENYWGMTAVSSITFKIQDYSDDADFGVVDFCPFLDAPYPSGHSVSCDVNTTIEMGETFSDYGSDTDGNGLYDYLVVELNLAVPVSGVYDIDAVLIDSSGDHIFPINDDEFTLTAGENIVKLNFSGRDVYATHVDGPYLLKRVEIHLAGGDPEHRYYDVYNTSSYDYEDFEVFENKLNISEITINVNDTTVSADERGGVITVSPGSELNVSVTVENVITTIYDVDIQNINVEVELPDIDDYDEIYLSSSRFNLSSGRDKTVAFSINIPSDAESGRSYDMFVTAYGRNDDYQMSHYDEVNFTIRVVVPELNNTPPVFSGVIPNLAWVQNTTHTLNLNSYFSDVDGDMLDYAFPTTPELTATIVDGVVTFIPAAGWYGSSTVVVTASDGEHSAYSNPFTLTVTQTPVANETAQENKLIIKDAQVKVDGDKDSGADEKGGTIDKDVYPGSEISVKVVLENLFEDKDIEDITVEGILEDVDDGGDITDSEEISKISAKDDKSVTLTFKIPLEIDEGDYNLVITAEGEDEDGQSQEASVEFNVKVEKKSHLLQIEDARLGSSVLSCRSSTTLRAKLLNLGRDDEDDIVLRVTSSELGIDLEDDGIELSSDVDDDEYTNTFNLDIDEEIAPGTYPITISAYYDDGKLADSETVELEVEECNAVSQVTTLASNSEVSNSIQPVIQTEKNTVSSKTEELVVQYPTGSTPVTTNAVAKTRAMNKKQVSTSFKDSTEYILVLLISAIIIVGLILALIGVLVMKPKKNK